MAVPLIVIGVSIAIAAAGAAYAIYIGSKQKKNNMSPQTLDSFGVTQAREGSVVPLVYGKCRVPGNIIFYGNPYTEEITAEAEGGGKGFGIGGGGGEQVTGYKYYLDVWQTIGVGKLSLIDTYVNDNHVAVETAETLYNDGTTTVAPTAYVTDSNKLGGIAHVFYRRLYLGDNTTQVPTIHFIVSRALFTGLPNENLSNGNNPAAIVYDLLLQAGISVAEIDSTSFIDAANFWYAKGYGLNMVFAEQKNLFDLINTVLQQVDGVFFVNASGKYAIQAYNPAQVVDENIDTLDLYEFSLNRPAYSQLPNDLKATFVDESLDFSERVIELQNSAAVQISGRLITKSFDLKGFRDCNTASKRLAEIAKYTSYPVAKIDFSTNFKFANLVPGDIVQINYDDLGISNAKFRIDSVDIPGIDSLLLKFKATQVAESLFDVNYSIFGGSEYVRNPIVPSDYPRYRTEFVLPYNSTYKTTANRVFLIERANEHENGFMIQARSGVEPSGPPYIAGADAAKGYFNVGFLRSFSRMVRLWHQSYYSPYPFDNTYTIDDGIDGILIYTRNPHLDLTQLQDISRAELFSKNRFLFISTLVATESPVEDKFARKHKRGELIAFQKIEAITSPDPLNYPSPTWQFYRISNFLRGALFTKKQNHSPQGGYSPLECWIFSISDNVLQQSQCGSYRVLLPSALTKSASPSDTHPYFPLLTDGYDASFAIKESTANFGPFQPANVCGSGRIYAMRSGSNITVKYYPATYTSTIGAGLGNPDLIIDSSIFDYAGTLYFEHGATIVTKTSPDVDYAFTDASAVILKVYQKLPGRTNNACYGELSISTTDGTYIAYTEHSEELW